MNRIPNSVGLDYHQEAVQVCVMDHGGTVLGNRSVPNDVEVIVTRAEQYGDVGAVAIESCSGAANLAEELVHRAGWSVDLAHPGYVQRMKGSPDKTDFSDARMLADLARVGYVPRVWLAPWAVRPVPFGQTTGPVLRSESAERLQRSASSRRRTDPGLQPPPAGHAG